MFNRYENGVISDYKDIKTSQIIWKYPKKEDEELVDKIAKNIRKGYHNAVKFSMIILGIAIYISIYEFLEGFDSEFIKKIYSVIRLLPIKTVLLIVFIINKVKAKNIDIEEPGVEYGVVIRKIVKDKSSENPFVDVRIGRSIRIKNLKCYNNVQSDYTENNSIIIVSLGKKIVVIDRHSDTAKKLGCKYTTKKIEVDKI